MLLIDFRNMLIHGDHKTLSKVETRVEWLSIVRENSLTRIRFARKEIYNLISYDESAIHRPLNRCAASDSMIHQLQYWRSTSKFPYESTLSDFFTPFPPAVTFAFSFVRSIHTAVAHSFVRRSTEQTHVNITKLTAWNSKKREKKSFYSLWIFKIELTAHCVFRMWNQCCKMYRWRYSNDNLKLVIISP